MSWQEQAMADLKEIIPPHDREIRLDTLAPSPKSRMPEEMQAQVIETMKLRWRQGWAFFGPAGWSKTTFSTALLRRVFLTRWVERSGMPHVRLHVNDTKTLVYRLTCSELLEEYKTYEFRDSNNVLKPRVRREVIKALSLVGHPPSLFLEEIDKIKGTKWKLDILFEIFNALYEYNCQLVLSSNFTPEEFTESFGPEFARRVGEMCNVVNCFTQEIKLLKETSDDAARAVQSNA